MRTDQHNLKKLSDIVVSHAEMEFLYDQQKHNSGYIDPNILSAGGFPAYILGVILSQIKLDPDMDMISDHLEFTEHNLNKVFPELKGNTGELATKMLTVLSGFVAGRTEIDNFFIELQRKKDIMLSMQLSSLHRYLMELFDSEEGLSSVDHTLWKKYRVAKIREMLKLISNGEDIGNVPNAFLKDVHEYLSTFLSTLTIDYSQEYFTFDVVWESDLSYFIAYMLEAMHGKTDVRVLIDVHSNTGLFLEIPLEVIFKMYSRRKFEKIYSLLIRRKWTIQEGSWEIKDDQDSVGLHYTQKDGLVFRENQQDYILTKDALLAQNFTGKSFKQYAYLWEHFPKSSFDVNNDSHLKMYLSNLLNAKSSFFEILSNRDQSLVPKYKFIKNIGVLDSDEQSIIATYGDKFIVKEGGWCSTGGGASRSRSH